MSAQDRRATLLEELRHASGPLAGGKLAKWLGVSRQIIVGDIAVLRASGEDIVSTARGYVLSAAATMTPQAPDTTPAAAHESPRLAAGQAHTRTIKVRHTVEQTSDELFTILENGGEIVDVSVSHRVYGRLTAHLGISTREEALAFLNGIASGASEPLLTVTSGYHHHTIAAPSEAQLDRIERALDAKGYLAPLLPYERD